MIMYGLDLQTSRVMSLNTLRKTLENVLCCLATDGLG